MSARRTARPLLSPAEVAIVQIARRVREDSGLRHSLGAAAMELLCAAVADVTGEPLADVTALLSEGGA